jgi:ankyrin repeat protein
MAHNAVELDDIPALRDLLDAGDDVEDDDGDGWTLLRHAVDVEVDSHDQTGKPLHVDVTAFLLSRGANPLSKQNGVSVLEEAEQRGHWLAAELFRTWIARSETSSQK